MGADRGILVKTDATVEPLAVAQIPKEVSYMYSPASVIMGNQAIDDDSIQTGQIFFSSLSSGPREPSPPSVEITDGKIDSRAR